ncbi:SDR family NAD(P)-dependent oxidoreductase [Glutamicibacter protophormiae]|uniref:NAD(P)-dependent dehydrogenase (Short-subunit alcohol dehydrogenase family) n=1 Tax=Glutamicibacter protophormiae TaxID=37930 RepID=A0ABS4XL85_GLUPR|nr:SDR family NAD(P)-dependent oxidoreductase [Glutamicibacter protophormiae]MBP2397253.1 NAD(P)-dependent dehydrogenase (short-subunit alcohol dehydrogenase family) [Glutamicibacter protophormiae]GGL80683.1 3-hydroxyacyl-CoA dehydrogenase [Glutamicibacter protophormiae]
MNIESSNHQSGSIRPASPGQWQDAGVLVVGATSGLGTAAAQAFAGAGARVVVAGRNQQAGERIAAELSARYAKVDVLDSGQLKAALAVAAEAPQGLRAVVNAAGSAIVRKTADRHGAHDLESFTEQIQTNLIGSFNVLRLAAEALQGQEPLEGFGRGVIVLTSSIAGFEGQRGQVAYAASKGGVNAMVLPAARDLARDQIRVLGVAPGVFDTPFMDVLPEEAKAELGHAVPFPQRLGNPGEYGKLVVDLVSNQMMNGEVVRLDGALRLG